MKQMTRATLDGIELEYEVRGAPNYLLSPWRMDNRSPPSATSVIPKK